MFRTEISNFDTKISINIQTPILSMGSCFAAEIGQKLENHKFNIQVNPGGILFNPLSIFELIETSLDNKTLPAQSFLENQERFLNYKLHSDVNADSEEALQAQIGQLQQSLRESISQARLIIFTFGTAWTYRLKAHDMLVANCHKVPQSQFDKKLLEASEITRAFNELKSRIQTINPEAQFLLTVSPVRHIKDTIPLNSVSKSVLRMACHKLTEAHADVGYFPSYEMMMDDLRDYRFYKKDLIHPNEQAIDYIWNKFTENLLDTETLDFVNDWTKIRAALAHRPFHARSASHQQFLKDTLKKVENFGGHIDVSEEVAFLGSQMIHP